MTAGRARRADDRVEPDWERASMAYEAAWVERLRLSAWRWRVGLAGVALVVATGLLGARHEVVIVEIVALVVALTVFGILIAAFPCPRCGESFPYAPGNALGIRITLGAPRSRFREPRVQCSSCGLVRLPVSGHDRAVLDGAFDDPGEGG